MVIKKRFDIALYFLFFFIASCGTRQDNVYKEMSKDSLSLPYILELNTKNKELLYFGTYHSNDINDSLFDRVETRFKVFNPDYVLHEGGSNWPIFKSIDSTVMISGEPGFIIQLSKSKGVPYSSIEPREIDEYQSLNKEYNKSDILLMYICRQIDQQQRINISRPLTDQEFETNMVGFLNHLKYLGFDLNEEELKYQTWEKVYSNFFKEKLDWRTFDASNYYPNFFKNRLNEINRSSDKFRNEFMVNTIIKTLKKHDKVMVLVGGGHLFIQKDTLKKKFTQNFN